MTEVTQAGIFALAGTLLGGIIAYAAASVGHKWEQAQKDIRELATQVSSYYQLETLYKKEMAERDPGGRSAKTIQEDMRSQVEQSGEFERPRMTTLQANRILRKWA